MTDTTEPLPPQRLAEHAAMAEHPTPGEAPVKITINAHQLGRLIDTTISHMSGEDIEQLHGIRLDVGSTYLYAVTSDRYTIAAARYRLDDTEQNSEPFARTIPGNYLRSLREWVSTQVGHGLIAISTTVGRLVFAAPDSEFHIPVTDDLWFPNWRSLLRSVAEQTIEGEPFPALDSGFLARWAGTGNILRVRVTADQKALLVFAEDFIGAQMPARYAGVGPVKDETIDSARHLWKDVLDAGATGVDMATDMPEDEPGPRYEAPTDVREVGTELLKQTIHSQADMYGKSGSNPEEFYAHLSASVNAWMAYRFLDALHTADPRLAASTAAEVAGQLDSGEIGEFAWDAAVEAGHDPQKWHDDYKAHLKDRAAKKAAETVRPSRAEVLREAADALEARVTDVDVDVRKTWAAMDADYLRSMATVAALDA